MGYDIERRDRATGRWVKLNKEPVRGQDYYDDRVQEGHQYEYRVSAVNAAGNGKPSDTSNVFIAKPMKGNELIFPVNLEANKCGLFAEKPKLWLDGIIGRKIKVRAGEPINIDIPLTGAPAPKVDWIKNKLPIPESSRLYVSAINANKRPQQPF